MYHDFDTENSCRKYQVCKPVAPQRNRNRDASIAVFSCFDRISITIRKEPGNKVFQALISIMYDLHVFIHVLEKRVVRSPAAHTIL